MESYRNKCSRLLAAVDRYTDNDVAVAFSGGVDSSLILKLACSLAAKKGTAVHAFTVHTELHPMNDVDIAVRVAEDSGAVHHIIHVDEMEHAGIENNPVDRCYRCKRYLFTELKKNVEKLGIDTIMEGTNEDDLHEYRPGIRAVRELDVLSPLAHVGMTKEEVRKMAREYGVAVAERPSAPCLATRFPYGTALSVEVMRDLEKGEDYLRSLGFYNVRIRVHDDIARIEVDMKDIEKFLEMKDGIISFLKGLGFVYITLDLEGFRSGSMDVKVMDQE